MGTHPDLLCDHAAEALSDFLQNFLSVDQNDAGETETRNKYLVMLVRPRLGPVQAACGRHSRLNQPHAPPSPTPCGVLQQEIANRKRSTLEVELDDLEAFAESSAALVTHIERNTQQYLQLVAEAADPLMPQPNEPDLGEDVFDVLLDQVGGRAAGLRAGPGCWMQGVLARLAERWLAGTAQHRQLQHPALCIRCTALEVHTADHSCYCRCSSI